MRTKPMTLLKYGQQFGLGKTASLRKAAKRKPRTIKTEHATLEGLDDRVVQVEGAVRGFTWMHDQMHKMAARVEEVNTNAVLLAERLTALEGLARQSHPGDAIKALATTVAAHTDRLNYIDQGRDFNREVVRRVETLEGKRADTVYRLEKVERDVTALFDAVGETNKKLMSIDQRVQTLVEHDTQTAKRLHELETEPAKRGNSETLDAIIVRLNKLERQIESFIADIRAHRPVDIEPKPAKKKFERWINLYPNGVSGVYFTQEVADRSADSNRIECRKIEWEV